MDALLRAEHVLLERYLERASRTDASDYYDEHEPLVREIVAAGEALCRASARQYGDDPETVAHDWLGALADAAPDAIEVADIARSMLRAARAATKVRYVRRAA